MGGLDAPVGCDSFRLERIRFHCGFQDFGHCEFVPRLDPCHIKFGGDFLRSEVGELDKPFGKNRRFHHAEVCVFFQAHRVVFALRRECANEHAEHETAGRRPPDMAPARADHKSLARVDPHLFSLDIKIEIPLQGDFDLQILVLIPSDAEIFGPQARTVVTLGANILVAPKNNRRGAHNGGNKAVVGLHGPFWSPQASMRFLV